MNQQTSAQVLCERCQGPIATRRDLAVMIKGKEIKPFHHRCFIDQNVQSGAFGMGTDLHYAIATRKVSSVGLKILIGLFGLAFFFLLALLALTDQSRSGASAETYSLVFVVPIIIIGMLVLTRFMNARHDMLAKQSWERFESKLPE